jgi:hypothetical protein
MSPYARGDLRRASSPVRSQQRGNRHDRCWHFSEVAQPVSDVRSCTHCGNRAAPVSPLMRGDRLREAIQLSAKQVWIASSLSLLAMTNSTRKTARRANHFVFSEMACQNISFRAGPKSLLYRSRPVPQRGVAHVTNAGRDAVDAGSARDEWC